MPVLLLSVAVMSSCIKEDPTDCPGLWITFDMLNPALEYTEEVEHLDLYIFNMNGPASRAGAPTPGTLVSRTSFQLGDMRPNDLAIFVEDLAPGDYHFTVTVNCNVWTETRNWDDYASLDTKLKSNEMFDAVPCNFLSGELPVTVTGRKQQEIITLLRHNNDIKLNLKYEGYALPEGMALDPHIYGNNGLFDYSEHACPEDIYALFHDWGSQTDPDTGLPSSFDLTTMRLCHERQVILYLEEVPAAGTRADQEPRSVSIDLAAELAKVADEEGNLIYDTDAELEHHNRYEFTITLDGNFAVVSVSVKVNDWDHTGGGIDF